MARYGSPQRRSTPPPPPTPPEDVSEAKVIVSARLTPAARAKAHQVAGALNISISALLCELVERLDVDEAGHPGWESKYAPPADEGQEQLEMSA